MDKVKFRLTSARKILQKAHKDDLFEERCSRELEGYERRCWNDIIDSCIVEDKAIWDFALSEKLNYIDENLKGSKCQENWFSLDINPRENIMLANFMTGVSGFLTKDAVIRAEWAYEQRGEDEENMGKGFHVHINLIYSRCRKDLLTAAQKFFKEFASAENINVRVLALQKDLMHRQNYIRGIKTKEKLAKVAMDKPFREKNKIKDIYSKGGLTISSPELLP